MNSKLSRAILALLIGISFPIFTGNQVVSAAPGEMRVLGEKCKGNDEYSSNLILENKNGTTEIAGICFPSLNDPKTFIWSKDGNKTPVYKLVVENDGKIAFGRGCKNTREVKTPESITPEKKCLIQDPITLEYLITEPFVKEYPDTKHVDTLGGMWWSEVYEDKIIKVNYLDPTVITETEDTTQVGGKGIKDVSSKILLIAIAALASISTSAATSSSGSATPRPESPDAPELLRARKERRFATTNRVGRFFQGSVISMDRWAFFTAKLPALIRKVGKRSSVAATSIGDADYLRAVLGIFTLLFYPAAILIGVLEFNSLTKETLPIPGTTWLIAALVIGCLDSLAGAISALTFILLTVICNLGNANINWLTFIGTLVFIFILSTGPALFAGALRRFDGVHTNRKGKWERLVDYALSPIVTAWVVWKGLELLPKISEKKEVLNWADNINKIAVIISISIFIRYFIEGFVAKHFAERINEIVTESIPMQSQSKINLHIRKAFWITLIAYLLLVPETVSDKIMLLVFLSLLLPAVTLSFGIKPTDSIAKFNIIGTPRLVFLLCTGLALSSIFTSKGVESNLGLFIVLAFGPILYFNLMEALTESNLKSPAYFYQTRIGRFLYRAGSVLLYIFIISVIYTQVGWKPW